MWKKILLFFVGVILVSVSTIFYFFFIKEYDTADENVDEIVSSDFDIILPNDLVEKEYNQEKLDDTESIKSETSEETDGEETTQTISNDFFNKDEEEQINKTEQNNSATKQSHNDIKEKDTPSSEKILAKYEPSFRSLQEQAESRLLKLAQYALDEYKSKKKNGERVSYSYFFQKYKAAANQLESRTDETFYYIYDQMVNELNEYGYSESIAEKVLKEYKSIKKDRESKLISQALKMF
ncbi:hypothetical protein ACLIA0_10005 [Bacillaceae bacterium W0354]